MRAQAQPLSGPQGIGGRVRTTPLFENMGLIIRPNLHRNNEGVVVSGGGGIENVIEEEETEECKPLNTSGNCISANPKLHFFLGREGPPPPDSPPNSRGMSGFSCTPSLHTFKHLAPSLINATLGRVKAQK